jgi:hypothetical protein
MNVEVIRRHIHVTHGNQRRAHINTNGAALIRVIVFVIVAHVADISRRSSCSLQVLYTLAELARIRRLLLWLSLVRQVRFVVIGRCQLTL